MLSCNTSNFHEILSILITKNQISPVEAWKLRGLDKQSQKVVHQTLADFVMGINQSSQWLLEFTGDHTIYMQCTEYQPRLGVFLFEPLELSCSTPSLFAVRDTAVLCNDRIFWKCRLVQATIEPEFKVMNGWPVRKVVKPLTFQQDSFKEYWNGDDGMEWTIRKIMDIDFLLAYGQRQLTKSEIHLLYAQASPSFLFQSHCWNNGILFDLLEDETSETGLPLSHLGQQLSNKRGIPQVTSVPSPIYSRHTVKLSHESMTNFKSGEHVFTVKNLGQPIIPHQLSIQLTRNVTQHRFILISSSTEEGFKAVGNGMSFFFFTLETIGNQAKVYLESMEFDSLNGSLDVQARFLLGLKDAICVYPPHQLALINHVCQMVNLNKSILLKEKKVEEWILSSGDLESLIKILETQGLLTSEMEQRFKMRRMALHRRSLKLASALQQMFTGNDDLCERIAKEYWNGEYGHDLTKPLPEYNLESLVLLLKDKVEKEVLERVNKSKLLDKLEKAFYEPRSILVASSSLPGSEL